MILIEYVLKSKMVRNIEGAYTVIKNGIIYVNNEMCNDPEQPIHEGDKVNLGRGKGGTVKITRSSS